MVQGREPGEEPIGRLSVHHLKAVGMNALKVGSQDQTAGMLMGERLAPQGIVRRIRSGGCKTISNPGSIISYVPLD